MLLSVQPLLKSFETLKFLVLNSIRLLCPLVRLLCPWAPKGQGSARPWNTQETGAVYTGHGNQTSSYLSYASYASPVASFLCCMALLGGCQTPPPGPHISMPQKLYKRLPPKESPGKSVYKVALLLPLSGAHKDLGDSLRQAAEMSVFDRSYSPLELMPLDTQGTVKGAKDATEKALEKGADILLGPVFSPEAKAVKEVLRGTPYPVLCYSTDTSLGSPDFFVFGFDVAQQIQAIMQYASSQDMGSVTVIVPQSTYGRVVESALGSMGESSAITIHKVLTYTSLEKDLPRLAQALLDSQSQALFIPEGPPGLYALLSGLESQGVPLKNYQLLGTGQWDHPEVFEHAEVQGAWFPNAPMDDRLIFEERYKEAYGVPPHRLASLAYDSVAVVATMIQQNPKNPFAPQAFVHPQGFVGVDGTFRFLSNGLTQRHLVVFHIMDRQRRQLTLDQRRF